MPDVHHKLQEVCLSVETLVYHMIESMYSSHFKSDIVYRLWDQIFYHLARIKSERKRGLWWLLAPAAEIICKRQDQILQANSAEEVLNWNQKGYQL